MATNGDGLLLDMSISLVEGKPKGSHTTLPRIGLVGVTGVPQNFDTTGVALEFEEPWQSCTHDGCILDLVAIFYIEHPIEHRRQDNQTSSKARGSQRSKANNVCMHCQKRGIGRGSAHNSSKIKVLQRSRRLTKDEMILRVGDGKVVAMEAVGLVELAISHHFTIVLNDYFYVPNRSKDRGREYLSAKFIGCLEEAKIISRWTSPRTPHLNGVSEKRNLTLLDIVRSMMSFTELLLSFWVYALEMAAKLLNMEPSKKISQMPYVIWHGKPVSYKYLKVWGSPAYVKRLVKDKLSLRSSLCRFIRYPKETAAYYFYDPSKLKVFVLQNTLLMEKGFPSDSRPQ
ncbi:hypothetical protein Sango_2694000 [Sesamum angolense]|uniref:Integrase catalytic domain-containing protein n=1 Tax=Sesamum angolense TaxID=2727404 RepID=A0AAE2BHN9_9LAMI|nr:hypothetical protein Sango_2694000 [Sesamum angolense]